MFVHLLSMAAFILTRQIWVVAIKPVWLEKPKILIICPFIEKVCWPLLYKKPNYLNSLSGASCLFSAYFSNWNGPHFLSPRLQSSYSGSFNSPCVTFSFITGLLRMLTLDKEHFTPSGNFLSADSLPHSSILVCGASVPCPIVPGASLLCSLFYLHFSIQIIHHAVIIRIRIEGGDLIHLTNWERNTSRLGSEFRRPGLKSKPSLLSYMIFVYLT